MSTDFESLIIKTACMNSVLRRSLALTSQPLRALFDLFS